MKKACMDIEKINDESLFYNYDRLADQVKTILDNMWFDKKIVVGGVVKYEGFISNSIKIFTQSIFSHINFFDENTCVSIGSEDMIGVERRDYGNKDYGEFYYITKPIDLNSLIYNYNIEEVYSVSTFYNKRKQKINFDENMENNLDKNDKGSKENLLDNNLEDNTIFKYFVKFCYFREIIVKGDDVKLCDILKMNYKKLESIDNKEFNKINQNAKKFFELKKQILEGNYKVYDEFLFEKYRKLLKEFIVYGIIQVIINYCNTKYDLKGTLSISISPWDEIDSSNNEYFCSEFVSECLFYAGIYPFDIHLSDPESVSPGDIMDMKHIFIENDIKLYKIGKQQNELYIKQIAYKGFIKSYIIREESRKISFIRQKLIVSVIEMIINEIAEKTINMKKKQLQNNSVLKDDKLNIENNYSQSINYEKIILQSKYNKKYLIIILLIGIFLGIIIANINIFVGFSSVSNGSIDYLSIIGGQLLFFLIYSLYVLLFFVVLIIFFYYIVPVVIKFKRKFTSIIQFNNNDKK